MKYMEDSLGRQVPINLVPQIDLLRDQVVRKVVEEAKAMRDRLAAFKAAILADLTAFFELSFEEYGKKYGGRKGNITLTSYDGRYKLILAYDETISFNERLQVAKSLIDSCIRRWSKGANHNIQALVQDAFYVDTEGRLNSKRILGLRRLKIEDTEWLQAMEAITKSVLTLGRKQYLRVYEKDDKGAYHQIALDIAAI